MIKKKQKIQGYVMYIKYSTRINFIIKYYQ